LKDIIDIIVNTDDAIRDLILRFGNTTYLILFSIIFAETGLLIFPFLPGDGLLFSAGVVASAKALNIFLLIPLFLCAALTGNVVNYFLGRFVGYKLINIQNKYFQKYLSDATQFYHYHGGKAVIISRFFPILRTYVPFVAGIAGMNVYRYVLYSIIGASIWVPFFSLLGFFLGEIQWVQDHYGLVFLLLFLTVIIPAAVVLIKRIIRKRKLARQQT
jgi:membrane-associated protein